MRCPQCSNELKEGAKFCTKCGHKLALPPPIPCPHCQNLLSPTAKFCTKCGTNLQITPPAVENNTNTPSYFGLNLA